MTPISIPLGGTGPSPSPREVPSSLIPLGGKDGALPVQRVPVRYSFTSGYGGKDKEKEKEKDKENEKERDSVREIEREKEKGMEGSKNNVSGGGGSVINGVNGIS